MAGSRFIQISTMKGTHTVTPTHAQHRAFHAHSTLADWWVLIGSPMPGTKLAWPLVGKLGCMGVNFRAPRASNWNMGHQSQILDKTFTWSWGNRSPDRQRDLSNVPASEAPSFTHCSLTEFSTPGRTIILGTQRWKSHGLKLLIDQQGEGLPWWSSG